MQEIANRVVATCFHNDIHELLSRYKKQLPHSQIFLITQSAIKEELEFSAENPALHDLAKEHLQQIVSSGPNFLEKYALKEKLELPNIPTWIAEQMTESERAAFAKWYNKVNNEIEANKLGDTLKNG